MADKEDSIHVRIKLDVDEEDRAFTDNLAGNMARSDEQQAIRKVTQREGAIPEEIEEDIEQLEKEIKEIQKAIKKETKDPEALKQKLEVKKNNLLVKQFKEGKIGQINDFSDEQFRNLKQVITNPIQFFVAALGKKIGKAARTGGAAGPIGILVALFVIIAKDIFFILFNEATKPGRPLDRRFKRIARLEVMSFYDRQLQEELRHGYAEIRVSTKTGLRGGQSQVNGNLFEFGSGATGIIQSSPYRSSQDIYRSQNARGLVTDRRGSPRRRTVHGRLG